MGLDGLLRRALLDCGRSAGIDERQRLCALGGCSQHQDGTNSRKAQ